MSAGLVLFPVEQRHRAIARDWLHLRMRELGGLDESQARYWSGELCGSVRTNPDDLAKMHGDLAAARKARQ